MIPPRITQKEIARIVGVSQPVVASVLGSGAKKVRVGQATREKILQVAREKEYRPHRAAQLLKSGFSGQIGVISSVPHSPLGAQRIYHLSLALERVGMQAFFQPMVFRANTLEGLVKNTLDAQVEGLVLMGLDVEGASLVHRLLESSPTPYVFMFGAGTPRFAADNAQGVELLVDHALSSKYRRIWFEAQGGFTGNQRLDGFLRCQSKIEAVGGSHRIIHRTAINSLHFDYHGPGQALASRILENPSHAPDMVLCHNDHAALALQTELVRAGWRIPQDIAVSGFDNEPFGLYAPSTLTTVAQPLAEVINEAIDHLMSMINGEAERGALLDRNLPCQLIVRASSSVDQDVQSPVSSI